MGVGNGTLRFGGWEWYIEIWVVGNGALRFGGFERYIEIWRLGMVHLDLGIKNGTLRFGVGNGTLRFAWLGMVH